VAITDELMRMAEESKQPVAEKSNWIADLIDKRYQPQEKRKLYTPQGFDFKREPFDPSSYFRSINNTRDISKGATAVVYQEVQNREEAEAQRMFDENQARLNKNLGGVDPRFTYDQVGGGGGGNYSNGSSKKYRLGRVSGNTAKAADYFGNKYGIKTIGGYGGGSVPGSDHPKGRALDYMINNVSKGKSRGDALANDVIQNYKKWNVKYVIWNRYIWQPGRGWRKYSGPSDHTDHVHVSFKK
jgi:hypothetical protein